MSFHQSWAVGFNRPTYLSNDINRDLEQRCVEHERLFFLSVLWLSTENQSISSYILIWSFIFKSSDLKLTLSFVFDHRMNWTTNASELVTHTVEIRFSDCLFSSLYMSWFFFVMVLTLQSPSPQTMIDRHRHHQPQEIRWNETWQM